MNRFLLIAIAASTAACAADLDEPWQLEHDRIIAVRAEPPAVLPGEQAQIDLLVGFAEGPVAERAPDVAQVVSPMSLASSLGPDAGAWVVTAPSEDKLAAARTELGLPAGAPVPLQVGVAAAWPNPVKSYDSMHFGAVKTVWLGETRANPTMTGLTINGVDPGTDDLVVPKDTEVRLFVEGDDTVDIVNWLTSCGTMHDFDAHSAYLTVAPEDPQEGQLVLVFRDPKGGVTWRVWNIRAE